MAIKTICMHFIDNVKLNFKKCKKRANPLRSALLALPFQRNYFLSISISSRGNSSLEASFFERFMEVLIRMVEAIDNAPMIR
jgi:hypothetical protein